ncbi:MAG: response regulator [Chloroflexota bacterium]
MGAYILLVDDNKDLTDNLKLVLEMEGFGVRTVSSGAEAIAAIREEVPVLIVADIVMKGVNGYDLFQSVKANQLTVEIPFIFLSARTTPDDVGHGLKLGADAYVTKPFAVEELISIVHRFVRRG